MTTFIRKVYKVDNSFIILREDETIPALGEVSFVHRTARQALEGARMEAESWGAKGADVCITPNEHADRETIISCGLTCTE
jgi:hypothetical protein